MNTVWHDYSAVNTEKGTAVAIGNFDGLHLGHQKLFGMLSSVAKEHGLPSVAYTFSVHPINVLKGENTLKLIANNSQKERLIKSCGVDTLFFEDFSSVKDLSAEDFVRDILLEKLNMKIAVVGYHNHYGKNSEGDVKLLRELGQKYGFEVYMIKPCYVDDNILASSSNIRKYIADGELDMANKLLGRPFCISNVIVKDKMLGKTIGFPTANMIPDEHLLLPPFGAYASSIKIGGRDYISITNIGVNPTFHEDKVRIETHIIGFSGDLYGETLDIELLYKIRDDVEFKSSEELKNQLEEDKKARIENN